MQIVQSQIVGRCAISRKNHKDHDAELERLRKENSIQKAQPSNKWWAFAESPILWGAIGMMVGSLGTLLSMWFFVVAWVLIGGAIVRTNFWAGESIVAQSFRNGFACLLLALLLVGFWRELPKPKEPPSADQIADAIFTKMSGMPIAQNQGTPLASGLRPNPPILRIVSVDSPADLIADKVVKKLSQR